MVKIINDVCQKSNAELEDMLADMNKVLEYNYRRFYSQDLLDQVWNELESNLEQAVAQLSRPMSQET